MAFAGMHDEMVEGGVTPDDAFEEGDEKSGGVEFM